MSGDKHLLVVFPTVFEPSGILQRKISRVRFCRVEDITGSPHRDRQRPKKQGVARCKNESDFVDVLTRTAPVTVTVTRDLGEDVDIDGVVKRKYRPIGVVRALSHVMDLAQLLELRVVGVKLPEMECQSMKFGALLNLHTLVLDAVGLRSLHPSVGRLSHLQVLSLQHNMLYDLPVTLRLLRDLETLNITGNFFSVLPGYIFHLDSLHHLIGVEACPLRLEPEWTKCGPLLWIAPPTCSSHLPRQQPESLRTAAIRSAVGLDCWEAGLPQACTDSLTEAAASHDLCENCLSAVIKLTPQQETTGYILKVQIPEFCGIRNIPFYFVACSIECRDEVAARMEELLVLQLQRLKQLEHTGVRLAQHLYQVECTDIWEMRRRSRLGRGVDLNLRANPAELVSNPNLALIDTGLIAQVLGVEAVPVVDMESPV